MQLQDRSGLGRADALETIGCSMVHPEEEREGEARMAQVGYYALSLAQPSSSSSAAEGDPEVGHILLMPDGQAV